MFTLTLRRFRGLPKETKAMVWLYFVYDFAEVLVGIFLNIFVFLQTDSILKLGTFNLFGFTGIILGFSVWGILVSHFKLSMRLNYLKSFAVYIASFLILIFLPHTEFYLYLFGLINGIGLGIFWVGVHSYEMLFTNDKNRDFYSSMVTAISQTLRIVGPAIATLTFIISERVLQIETFKLLFAIIPFVYLLSLPFIFSLPDYFPERIPLREWKRLFFDKKIKYARRYYIMQGFGWGFYAPTLAIIAIYSMGTVVNVGILETIVGIVSVLSVIFLSHKRHEDNRLNIMFWAVLVESIGYSLLLAWHIGPHIYIIYTLMGILSYPIYRVSEHVIDLKSVELIKEKEDASFYSGMLYRDFILGFSRIGATTTIILLALIFSEATTLRIGIILLVINNFLIWWAAKCLIEKTTVKDDSGSGAPVL